MYSEKTRQTLSYASNIESSPLISTKYIAEYNPNQVFKEIKNVIIMKNLTFDTFNLNGFWSPRVFMMPPYQSLEDGAADSSH